MRDAFSLSSFAFGLCRSHNLKEEIPSTLSKTVLSFGIRHGDMLFLIAQDGAELWHKSDVPFSTPVTSSSSPSTRTSSGLLLFY